MRGNICQVLAICGLLLLAVGLVFGQTVYHEFIDLDDSLSVVRNPHITAGLTEKAVKWAFTERYDGAWIPLTRISHMLDCQVYGLDAGAHHLTNVLLHAATAALLFLVLRQMTRRLWPSAFVAAVFAIHPLRVESVAWVTERKDVLSGLFFMLTLAAYVWYVRRRFSFVRYAAVIVFFAMGLMAKPMLVTLPFLLLLLDYWPLGRWTAPAIAARLVLEKIPLLALTVASCAISVWAYTGYATEQPDQCYSLAWRIGNVPIAGMSYIGMFFWPANLAIPYPRPSAEWPLLKVTGAAVVLAVVTSAAVVMRRKSPYLLVGWLWYWGMLVPVSGVFRFGLQTLSDRFTYLPQIGLCVALAWAVADASRAWPLRPALCSIAAATLLAVLMRCAWWQTSFWHDDLTLWNHTLECTSQNRVAHLSLGNTYVRLGKLDKAIDQYREAIAIEPGYSMPHYNLGVALAGAGRLDEAIAEYQKAVDLQPDNAVAHNNLAHGLSIRGRLETALFHCQEALRIDPHFAEAHFNAGNVWYRLGRLDEAIHEFQQALEANPGLAMVHYPLARALTDRDRLDEAIAEYGKSLETTSDFAADVHYHLGLALSARDRPDEAAAHFRSALAIRPNFIEARYHLSRVSP